MASRRFRLRLEPYNPDARDADGDGIVQEGTAWERPAGTRIMSELAQEFKRGAISSQRKQNWIVVDKDGNQLDYIPSYAKKAEIPTERPKTSLEKRGYRTIKSMGVRDIGGILDSARAERRSEITSAPAAPERIAQQDSPKLPPVRRTRPVSVERTAQLQDVGRYGDTAIRYRSIFGEGPLREFRGELQREREAFSRAYQIWKETGSWPGEAYGVSRPRLSGAGTAITRDLSPSDLAGFGSSADVDARISEYGQVIEDLIEDIDARLESIDRSKQGVIDPEITSIELRDHPEFEALIARGRELSDLRRQMGDASFDSSPDNPFNEDGYGYFFHVGAGYLDGGSIDPSRVGTRGTFSSETASFNDRHRQSLIGDYEKTLSQINDLETALELLASTGEWSPSESIASLTFSPIDKDTIDARPEALQIINDRVASVMRSLRERVDNPNRKRAYQAMKEDKEFVSLTSYRVGPDVGYVSGSQDTSAFYLLRIPDEFHTDLLGPGGGGEFGEYQTWEKATPILTLRLSSQDGNAGQLSDAYKALAERFVASKRASEERKPSSIGDLTTPDFDALAEQEAMSRAHTNEIRSLVPNWGLPTDGHIKAANDSQAFAALRALKTREERLESARRERRRQIELLSSLAKGESVEAPNSVVQSEHDSIRSIIENASPEVRVFLQSATPEEIETRVMDTALRVAKSRQKAPRVWTSTDKLMDILDGGYRPADARTVGEGRRLIETELGAPLDGSTRPVYGFTWFDFWDDHLAKVASESGDPSIDPERMVTIKGNKAGGYGPGFVVTPGAQGYGDMEVILSDEVGDRVTLHHEDTLLKYWFGTASVGSTDEELATVFAGASTGSGSAQKTVNLLDASLSDDLSIFNGRTAETRSYTESIIMGGFNSSDVRAIRLEGSAVKPDYKFAGSPDSQDKLDPVEYMRSLVDEWVNLQAIREQYGDEVAREAERLLQEMIESNGSVVPGQAIASSGSLPTITNIIALDRRRALGRKIKAKYPHIRVIFGSRSGKDPDDPRTYKGKEGESIDSLFKARLLSEILAASRMRLTPVDEDESVA